MPPLPLVLEHTAFYLFWTLPLAVPLLAAVGLVLWNGYRSGLGGMGLRNWLGCAFMGGIATFLLLQPIGWQLRLDQKGITLAAPFYLFIDGGSIAWSDLKDIRLGLSAGRHRTATVEFAGRSGPVLVLHALDEVPDGFWPAMIAVVESNAPAFRFKPDTAGWLAELRRQARADSPPVFQGRAYAAHDGAGLNID